MSLIIKHKTQSASPNDPGREISSDAWNEEHQIIGDVDADTVQGLTAAELQGQQGPKGDKGDAGPTHGRVGWFRNPISVGNYSVIGLGFRPKVIEFFVSKNDGMNTWFCECHGFADDQGNQNVSGWTGNFSNRFLGDMKTDRCIYAFNATPVVQVQATLVSMDADGFTLNFTVAGNTAFSIRWKAQ